MVADRMEMSYGREAGRDREPKETRIEPAEQNVLPSQLKVLINREGL
jgi:hypothetical protein